MGTGYFFTQQKKYPVPIFHFPNKIILVILSYKSKIFLFTMSIISKFYSSPN